MAWFGWGPNGTPPPSHPLHDEAKVDYQILQDSKETRWIIDKKRISRPVNTDLLTKCIDLDKQSVVGNASQSSNPSYDYRVITANALQSSNPSCDYRVIASEDAPKENIYHSQNRMPASVSDSKRWTGRRALQWSDALHYDSNQQYYPPPSQMVLNRQSVYGDQKIKSITLQSTSPPNKQSTPPPNKQTTPPPNTQSTPPPMTTVRNQESYLRRRAAWQIDQTQAKQSR